MGKGSKSAKGRNAFYFFMLDFKQQHGRNFKSMAEVATEAGPHWTRLPPHQKQKYEDMARQNKENQQKQTSIGESIELVQQEEKEKKEKEMAIKTEIDNIVRKGVNTNTIADQYFYLMHINEFCYWDRGNRYFPAEIALGKFNLRNGITNEDVYHALVHPGPLPLGYAANVKLKSEETHQLPHMGNENNIEEVLMCLINKLTETSDSDQLPPIYVSEKDILMIENILSWMCDDIGQANVFRLYSLQYLFYSLKNSISPNGIKVWPTVSISIIQLEKDVYDFCNGIACGYHETAEIPVYCSRSRIIRWVYIICDNCIGDLGLPIIKGQHVPINAALDAATASGVSIGQSRPTTPSVNQSERNFRYCDSVSEISTVVDESEISSYHGFDSDSQTADEEIEWRRPRPQKSRYRTPQNLSQVSDLATPLSQGSQTSSNSEYVPKRRPASQSSANPGIGDLSHHSRTGIAVYAAGKSEEVLSMPLQGTTDRLMRGASRWRQKLNEHLAVRLQRRRCDPRNR